MLKITIVDMDTNETVVDAESNCIIGAVKDKDGVQSIGFTRANAFEIVETIKAVDKVEKQLLDDKNIQLVYSALSLMEESMKRHAE